MSSDEICPNFVGCSGGFRREDNKKSLTNPAKSGTLITKQYTIEIVGKGGDRNAGTANVHVHDLSLIHISFRMFYGRIDAEYGLPKV